MTDAFVKLRAYGMDPTQGLLRDLGDTSSAMGKDLIQAVEAMADAVTGENERLKEFGIKASKQGGTITYEYTNRAGETETAAADAQNRAEIQETLARIFRTRYAGAMEKQSTTWIGMTSNLLDQWTRFQQRVMESGLFAWMKKQLADLLDTINQMAASGELDKWAKQVGAWLTGTFRGIVKFGNQALPVVQAFVSAASSVSSAVGGWGNLLKLFIGIKVVSAGGGLLSGFASLGAVLSKLSTSGVIRSFGASLLALASRAIPIAIGALRALGAAAMTNPIGLVIGAIAVAAGLLYYYWEPISGFFKNLWGKTLEVFSQAWQSIKSLFLDYHPAGLIIQHWEPISGFFKGLWQGVRDWLGSFSLAHIGRAIMNGLGVAVLDRRQRAPPNHPLRLHLPRVSPIPQQLLILKNPPQKSNRC